jgi:glycosyltransferase involved in cell wall biosynthesis
VNILFVNYGDFTANSLNHIGLFARALAARGHACVVAVPSDKETIRVIAEPAFAPMTYDEVLASPRCFPDGRGADILHAWTPRENVRRFAVAYRHLVPGRTLVHLEDNEDHLLSAMLRCRTDELRAPAGLQRADLAPRALSHPVRSRAFLRVADGATVIVDTLREFVPAGAPVLTLPPGVDFSLYKPQPADPALRAELGLRGSEKVLVYTGSNTFANEHEIRELYEAVALLNARGVPTRLIRTGLFSTKFSEPLPAEWSAQVVDMGFVEKALLPKLLALADALVQPGHTGAFNDYRLPSKLPEMLAMGRPVVAPASNVGRLLRNGLDAVLLSHGSAEEMAVACQRIWADAALAGSLASNAAEFARTHFELGAISDRLESFYRDSLAHPARIDAWGGWREAETELSPALRALGVGDSAAAELAYLEHLAGREWAIGSQVQAAAEQLAAAEKALALTQQHATNLAGQVEQLQSREADLTAQVSQWRQNFETVAEDHRLASLHIAHLDREIVRVREEGEARLQALKQTWSWKLTMPVRALRRFLQRCGVRC